MPVIKPIAASSSTLLAIWLALIPGKLEAKTATNLLEIRSLIVNGKPQRLGGAGAIRLTPFPERIAFGYGAPTNAPRHPLRLRYRLEGFDNAWHEGGGEMFLAIRFVDEAGDQIAQQLYWARGLSAGWTGDLKTSTLTHRREVLTVPVKASKLWAAISSGGPPATVGLFVVDNLVVKRACETNGLPEILMRSPLDGQLSALVPSQAPEGWVRDGYQPSMAKIVELGMGAAAKALAIWDEDSLGHAEWHTSKQAAWPVVPGEQLVVEWNELFTMGVGDAQEVTYGPLHAGTYEFQVAEVTPVGQPTGEVASLLVRVPLPFWQMPWFWATSVGLLVAASLASGRYYTHQRMTREMLGLRQQRMLEQERLRIAQDLHDDLGAKVTQISLLSAMAQGNTAFPESARSEFDAVSRMSRELVAALYQAVWAVNPENDNLDALGNYLCQMVNQLCTQARLRCRLDVVDLPRDIQVSSQKRHNITLAVKEAIHNVIKHAAASAVILRTVYVGGVLTVLVEDDGCGFTGARETRGSGLSNMKRRLVDVGGSCIVRSEPGEGTTVELRLEIQPPN